MYRFFIIITLFVAVGFCQSDWMQEQIKKELSSIPKKSLNRLRLREAMQGGGPINFYAEVAHIVIEKGKARVESTLTTGDWVVKYRLRRMVQAINKWQKKMRIRPSRLLPDSEFLVSLGDAIESEKLKPYLSTDAFPVPVFASLKKEGSSHLILFPDSRLIDSSKKERHSIALGEKTFPWEKKKDVLFWQGPGTDGEYTKERWSQNPRALLVLLSRQEPSLIQANFMNSVTWEGRAALDAILKKTGMFARAVPAKDFLAHKYLIDMGASSSDWESLFAGLLSRSVLFRQKSPFVQWFSKRLLPWRDYIPVQSDLKDLKKQLKWAKEHDSQAQEIAQRGQAVAQELLTQEKAFEYMAKLLKEYNKCFEEVDGGKR